MAYEALIKRIDHTKLSQRASYEEIDLLCREALMYEVSSVCIAPCYIKTYKKKYPNLKFTTVIGFPNGYQTLSTKVFETKEAISDGADEIDMVLNLTNLSNERWDLVEEEIKALRKATEGKVLKVIIETASLSEKEVISITKLLIQEKVDYIKTSTGFYKPEDPYHKVLLIKKVIEENNSTLKIKVSGGISNLEHVKRYDGLNIERFGASRLLLNLIES